MNALVEVSGLSISLGRQAAARRILADVSFELARGAFLSIVGRNGAGKSTLFKCIAGIFKGYAGTIRIDGRPSAGMSARERARHIAYVPQSAPPDIPYTVEEFMEMSRYPWRSVASRQDDRRAIEEAMRLTGIEPLAERRLRDLSGGERQKVMIAAAIAQGAACILMDEPTTYLDYAHQIETMEILSSVNKKRRAAMMVVTHDVNMAIQVSDRVIALSDGRIAWEGDPGELLDLERLKEIYGVRFERYAAEDRGAPPVVAPVGERAEPAR